MDINRIYEKTAKYRGVRNHTKDMVQLTLIRIAQSNAKMFIQTCEETIPDDIDTDCRESMFLGIVMAIDHAATTTALYDQLSNGVNNTIKELFGLQVAILGELLDSEMGKRLRKLHG